VALATGLLVLVAGHVGHGHGRGRQIVVRTVLSAGALHQLANQRQRLDQEGQGAEAGRTEKPEHGGKNYRGRLKGGRRRDRP